jgi:hypothetical protein
MDNWIKFSLAFVVLIISLTALAQELLKPQLLLSKNLMDWRQALLRARGKNSFDFAIRFRMVNSWQS